MNYRPIIIIAVMAVLCGYGFAAEPEEATTDQRLSELEQKIKIIERLREIEAEKAKEKSAALPIVGVGKDGFFLKSADGSFQLKFRGLYQTDARFYTGDTGATDTLLLRRVRPIFEGSLAGRFDFRVVPDFGDGKVVVQDALLGIRVSPMLNLQAGKFKEPFGLERLQSGANLLFVERGLPNNLVPNRDIGVQLTGDLAGGAVSYVTGAFNGVADGASADGDTNSEKDLAARIFARPFKSSARKPLQGLGFGVAVTFGKQSGTLPSYKTPGQQTLFGYATGASADGDHFRVSPQAYYSWASVGLLAELVSSSQDVKKGDVRATLRHTAWQVVTTYVLTGEPSSYVGITPAQTFAPSEGHWGAFEVAFRYGALRIDADAFARGFADSTKSAEQARAWSFGMNWYLSKNVKVVGDYERTTFSRGSPTGDREPEGVILSRLQIAF